MLDSQDFVAAENFLATAYARANASPGFQTFQIDTHALRLFLLIEEKAAETPTVTHFESIMEKLDVVISMVGEESHRPYALRVLTYIEPFIRARLSAAWLDGKKCLIGSSGTPDTYATTPPGRHSLFERCQGYVGKRGTFQKEYFDWELGVPKLTN